MKFLIKKVSLFFALLAALLGVSLTSSSPCFAYTANQVTFEFRSNGTYRVNLFYTVPALREFREASINFTNRQKAEKFYFDVVRGADFYVDPSGAIEFNNNQLSPIPW